MKKNKSKIYQNEVKKEGRKEKKERRPAHIYTHMRKEREQAIGKMLGGESNVPYRPFSDVAETSTGSNSLNLKNGAPMLTMV